MPSTVDVSHLIKETVWLERQKYEDAETTYYEGLVASKKKKGQQQQHQVSKGGSSAAAASSILKHPNRESESKQKKMEEIVTPKQEPVKGSGGSAKKSRHSKNKEKKGQVGGTNQTSGSGKGSKAQQVASNKQDVEKEPDTTLISSKVGGRAEMPELTCRIGQLEDENKRLTKVTDELKSLISKLELRVVQLEGGNKKGSKQSTPAAPAAKQAVASAADDDVDLFASDEENDEEKEKLHQERLKAYESKKSKKPALVAKSNVILDVKPWDDETDMKAMETQVRTVVMDGLVWGASKLVPLAYGIHKLQISCVVEDDKVSIDLLQEQIEAFDELVQSVDIAAFNKV